MTPRTPAQNAAKPRLDALAHAVSEILAPVVLAYVTCVSVALATTPSPGRGVRVGLVVATLCAGLPYVLIVLSSRRQLLSGRHVPALRERPAVLAGAALSAVLGLVAAVWLGASREMAALVVATVVGLVVAAMISTRWKLSIHMAGAAGSLCAIALVTSTWALAAAPVVVGLGWARVHLAAHDPAQVLAGSMVGFVITGVVMTWLG